MILHAWRTLSKLSVFSGRYRTAIGRHERDHVLKSPVQEWQSEVDGRHYQFRVEYDAAQTYTVYVNDDAQIIKGNFASLMFGFDEPLAVGDKELRLVSVRGGMDVAYDGHFLISGRPYFPRPPWVWIFVVLCVGLVLIGGIVGAIVGLIGSAACLFVSKTGAHNIVRIAFCAVITALTWVSFVLAYNWTLSL